MNRRAFLASLTAAFALDPERALWTPGRMISIPRANEPHLWMDVQNDARVFVSISPDNQPTRCYVVEPSAFRRQVSFPVSGTAPQITVVGRSPARARFYGLEVPAMARFYGIEVDRAKQEGRVRIVELLTPPRGVCSIWTWLGPPRGRAAESVLTDA